MSATQVPDSWPQLGDKCLGCGTGGDLHRSGGHAFCTRCWGAYCDAFDPDGPRLGAAYWETYRTGRQA